MIRQFYWILLVALSLASVGFSNTQYAYLKKYELPLKKNTIERSGVAPSKAPPLNIDMSGYYSDLATQKKVSIYLGMGAQWNDLGQIKSLFEMLQAIAKENELEIDNWKLQDNRVITFTQKKQQYSVTIGLERNEFMNSFSNHPIVMYMGHSRYGRGPAFEDMTNYYRMSDEYPTLEMEVRNRYFLNEPILMLDEYPLQQVSLDGKNYDYQYRGEKDATSYLPEDAYTKVIEGATADLDRTTFYNGKQIIFLASCSNEQHWKKLLRDRFTDPKETLFFGTNCDTGVTVREPAVFIMSIVRRLPQSGNIVEEIKPLISCFTAY